MTSEPSFCGTGGREELATPLFVARMLCHPIQASAPTARRTSTRNTIPPAFLTGGFTVPGHWSRIIGFFGETAPF
jgi:hypothetical protein